MALVDALSFLAVVQALLRDVDEVLDLGERSFQTTLRLGQRLDLRRHLVHLVLCFTRARIQFNSVQFNIHVYNAHIVVSQIIRI